MLGSSSTSRSLFDKEKYTFKHAWGRVCLWVNNVMLAPGLTWGPGAPRQPSRRGAIASEMKKRFWGYLLRRGENRVSKGRNREPKWAKTGPRGQTLKIHKENSFTKGPVNWKAVCNRGKQSFFLVMAAYKQIEGGPEWKTTVWDRKMKHLRFCGALVTR